MSYTIISGRAGSADSSESKESGNDSDTGIIDVDVDVDEVTIDTKTENGESDISENLTAPECIKDDNCGSESILNFRLSGTCVICSRQ